MRYSYLRFFLSFTRYYIPEDIAQHTMQIQCDTTVVTIYFNNNMLWWLAFNIRQWSFRVCEKSRRVFVLIVIVSRVFECRSKVHCCNAVSNLWLERKMDITDLRTTRPHIIYLYIRWCLEFVAFVFWTTLHKVKKKN